MHNLWMIKRFLHLHKFFEITGGKKKKKKIIGSLQKFQQSNIFQKIPSPSTFCHANWLFKWQCNGILRFFLLFVNIQVRTYTSSILYLLFTKRPSKSIAQKKYNWMEWSNSENAQRTASLAKSPVKLLSLMLSSFKWSLGPEVGSLKKLPHIFYFSFTFL